MLTKSGVKLLDFGLAKLQPPAREAVSAVTSLPTALHGEPAADDAQGTILGTFQYMSPEQLEGREADARSDIFSFGCVLYEMSTGRKAFDGQEPGEPHRLDPERRARPDLEHPADDAAGARPRRQDLPRQGSRGSVADGARHHAAAPVDRGGRLAAGLPAPVAARRKSREKLAWGVAAAATLAARGSGSASASARRRRRALVRFEIATPEGITPIDAPRISPDGRNLAFNATDTAGKTPHLGSAAQLSRRAASRRNGGHDAALLVARQPVPRFLRGGEAEEGRGLRRAAAEDLRRPDRRRRLLELPRASSSSTGRGRDPINRVSAAGGTPPSPSSPTLRARRGRSAGRSSFRTASTSSTWRRAEGGGQRVPDRDARLDGDEALAPAQTLVTYAPPGYLLFVRDRTLVAQPFDAKALKTTGEPIPLAEHIGTDTVGLARFSVSRDGTLAYRTGERGTGSSGWTGTGRRAKPSATRATTTTRPFPRAATASRSISPIRAAARPTSGSGISSAASAPASRSATATRFPSGLPTAAAWCSIAAGDDLFEKPSRGRERRSSSSSRTR